MAPRIATSLAGAEHLPETVGEVPMATFSAVFSLEATLSTLRCFPSKTSAISFTHDITMPSLSIQNSAVSYYVLY